MFGYSVLFAQIYFVFILSFNFSQISSNCNCFDLTCHCKNVEFIPVLPLNTTSVILEDFKCLLQKNFLANLSVLYLKELNFVNMGIYQIETYIFQNFPHLEKLTFKDPDTNNILLYNAFESLHLTNISKLEIIDLNLNSSLHLLLKSLTKTNITDLSLIRCHLTTFNSSDFFLSLKNLHYLNLSTNFFNQAIWSPANHLKVLVLKSSLINFNTFIGLNNTSLFPNMLHLEISVKKIEEINSNTFKGLDNLEHLYFGTEDINKISARFLSPIPKLKYLHIEGLGYIVKALNVEYGAFQSEHLQHLKLEYFRIICDYKGSLFRHTPNLLSLQLEITRILILDSELENELRPLKKLETFSMTYSALKKVPYALCNMQNLKRIALDKNAITFWNYTNCSVMSQLEFLSFSENAIYVIHKNTFSPLLISNDKLIWDLSLNSFFCTCDLLWFINWSLKIQERLLFYPKDYVCETPSEFQGRILSSSLLSNSNCFAEKTLLVILISIFIPFVIISIIVASFLYHKRWSLRYIFYLRQVRHKQKKEQEAIDNYFYDAFVCYHNSDTKWLLDELCPKLEIENNFSLCIHDRDFKAGWDIVENIVESIEKSRKVLLLLSNKFASSEWCRFEVTMAHQRVIEREENLLIIVLLEDIEISNQSRKLALLLKQKTYLKWTENKEGQLLFWHRLISCLKASNHNKD